MPTPLLEHVDVAVLGAGPGGYVAALRAAQNGLRVALIERESRLGGTCLLRGCIPTKSLLETARRLDDLRHAADFGIDAGQPTVDLVRVVRRKERIVAKLAAGISGLCKKKGVHIVHGTGRLAGPGRVEVQGADGAITALEADRVVLATGSSTRDMPGLSPDHRHILTSDSMLQLTALPRRLAVLGSGAVGVEFASIFRAFGSEVTIIEALDRLLPLEDEEISQELARAFRRRHIDSLTDSRLERAVVADERVQIELTSGGERRTLEVDALLVAVGRGPNSADLGLDTVGIEPDARGFIPVDARRQTCVEGIYAIGDLVASPALAHVATREGLIAADAIAGLEVQPLDPLRVPSAVYAHPEVASIGHTEASARALGKAVSIGRFPFAANGKASLTGDIEGFAKLVADAEDGRLLGAQLVGPHATELIAELGMALSTGASLAEVAQAIHAHPTLSEAIGEAALVGLGRPLHF